MAMKTSAQKAAEKDMWKRIAAALPDDQEVQAMCAAMLDKYKPTDAEVFASDLHSTMLSVSQKGMYRTSKEWAELCGVGVSDTSRVSAALRRLVVDGKMQKLDPSGESKVCKYCLA